LIKVKSLSVNLSREGIEYEATDETPQMIGFASEDSLYIDEYKGMYGLKSSKELLLPHTFFYIQNLKDTYLVQDYIEYKLFNLNTRKFMSDNSYEKVEYYKNYMMVLKNGKLFYLATKGKIVQ